TGACSKNAEPTPTPAASPAPTPKAITAEPAHPKPPGGALAEVEITGQLLPIPEKDRAKRYFVYITTAPCEPLSADVPLLAKHEVTPETEPRFMVEIFVPQGTKGYVCAVGLDESAQAITS